MATRTVGTVAHVIGCLSGLLGVIGLAWTTRNEVLANQPVIRADEVVSRTQLNPPDWFTTYNNLGGALFQGTFRDGIAPMWLRVTGKDRKSRVRLFTASGVEHEVTIQGGNIGNAGGEIWRLAVRLHGQSVGELQLERDATGLYGYLRRDYLEPVAVRFKATTRITESSVQIVNKSLVYEVPFVGAVPSYSSRYAPTPSSPSANCTYELKYPEIVGTFAPLIEEKLNQKLGATFFKTCDEPLVFGGDYTPLTNGHGVFSVRLLTNTWRPSPAPITNYSQTFVNVCVPSGQEIKLTDIIKPGSDTRLLAILTPKIADIFPDELARNSLIAELTPTNIQFGVTSDDTKTETTGIVIDLKVSSFEPGVFPGIALSWTELTPILEDSSPLSYLWRDKIKREEHLLGEVEERAR